VTGDTSAESAGEPYGRSFICPRWELRITERCLVDDLGLHADVGFDEALRHPIVDAFARERVNSMGEGKTVGPEAGPATLHRLGSGDRHRGATWWDARNKVVWLCGYGRHESGAADDAFQLFKQLIEDGRIRPTSADVETFLDDRAERLANLLPEAAARLLEEARNDPEQEKAMTIGGLRVSIVVRYVLTLEEVYLATLGGTSREDKALRLSLFPESKFGEWRLEECLPTRELEHAEYEVCHSIWHGEA
jgi:hypothetical protein